jgi:hypothetical protein
MAILSSQYVSTEPISIANVANWTFVAPEDTTIRVHGIKVLTPLHSVIDENQGVFKPLGGAKKIVVTSSIFGVDGDYTFLTQGETEWNALFVLLSCQRTIFVQDPLGRQKYIRFTTRDVVESGKLTNLTRTTKVAYVEVDAP